MNNKTINEIAKKCKRLSEEQVDDVLDYVISLEKAKEERGPRKLNIGLDFDGTICHTDYSKGWQGDLIIHGNAIPGAIDFLTQLCQQDDMKVYILSSRSKSHGFKEVLDAWLKKNGFDEKYLPKIYVTATKPPLHLYISDRAWKYQKRYPKIDEIREFKSWYEKTDEDCKRNDDKI